MVVSIFNTSHTFVLSTRDLSQGKASRARKGLLRAWSACGLAWSLITHNDQKKKKKLSKNKKTKSLHVRQLCLNTLQFLFRAGKVLLPTNCAQHGHPTPTSLPLPFPPRDVTSKIFSFPIPSPCYIETKHPFLTDALCFSL